MLRNTVKRTTRQKEVDMNFLFPKEATDNKKANNSSSDNDTDSNNSTVLTPYASSKDWIHSHL